MHHALTPALDPADVRQARQRLNNQGEVSAELLGPVLARSWQRSAHAGLAPNGRTPGAPHASAPQLARAQEQQHELLAHARPVMELLHEQTRDTDSLVLLANAEGLLLHSLGDADFMERAQRVALRPGATWHERWRGTNAVGTALAEGQALVVHGAEHYLERNAFLTCAAAPIFDPAGRVLGALDLSGDHRGFHRHTLGLVRSAARMVEHRLFETRHAASLRLRLHRQPEGIATLTEALLACSADGWLIGANDLALRLLGLAWHDVGAVQLQQVLDLAPDALAQAAARPGRAPLAVRTRQGETLWARVEAARHSITVTGSTAVSRSVAPVAAPSAMPSKPSGAAGNPGADSATSPNAGPTAQSSAPCAAAPAPQPRADALAALDTGDPGFRQTLERARRVLDKPIALLLQGESGVGKEVFARAVHASGPRKVRPLVAVNCAALPETLIEAELFGYRPGAFTGASREGAPGRIREADGGTLFLDEIGDMPLAMQGRLLRVLQERQVVPLGGGKAVPVDIQLICATHRQLRDLMRAGQFREDLYYRLNGLTLKLPALRERQDLGTLMATMLVDLAEPERHSPRHLNPALERTLMAYPWPGNLRQLSNALRTACAMMDPDESEVGWQHLPDDLVEDLRQAERELQARQPPPPDSPEAWSLAALRQPSPALIEATIAAANGNLSEAARRLGISRNTLYRRLKG